jgi:hypothetical protein
MDPNKPENRLAEVVGDERWEPIPFASTTLHQHRHVCAFFSSVEEEYRVLLPFIKAGFDRGERALHVVDPVLRDDHLRRLRLAGIDVAGAKESGQFEVLDWQDAYLSEGHFDQNRMLDFVEKTLDTRKQQGLPLTRLMGHMEWSLMGCPGSHDLVEYETRANFMSETRRDPIICIYDLTKFRGDLVIDIMRTHPVTIIGGILHENPYFVPPAQFLRQLRERRSTR